MAIPGFTAEQSLATLALHYHLAGRRRTSLLSRLHLMQEGENYDTGDGTEDDGGGGGNDGVVDGTDDGDNNITSDGGYDAGCQKRCNLCKNCQYQYGSYHCTGGFVVTSIPCGDTCGTTPCDQGT